ncbi:MAG TPA: DUF475 domain-containing protein [Pedomonas sp.]|uniref:DUF475 domain-containing protein n=1 Tax=Pedomonas sp. TaxID=2976421 RepID=UPI002F4175FC
MSAQPRSALSFYWGSIIFSVLAVVAGFALGGIEMAFLVAVLAILETSLSFDNAVVNAKILANWDERWRRIFLTWGIWIAVFGMRVVFPILIVTIATGIGPVQVIDMALNRPDEYATAMTAIHHQVAGFGGTFLLMVALGFFFEDKGVYWLGWAERKVARFGQIEGISAAVALTALILMTNVFENRDTAVEFLYSGVWGLIAYIISHGLGTLLGGTEADAETGAEEGAGNGGTFVKAGLAGFMYLEILDASFSFDGVIGAFALTNYLPVIALGLGVGAFFVRSMTLHLVHAGTLGQFRYLEHGAFYAILVLAGLLYASAPGYHIPEWITGLLGAALILISLGHSILANRRDRNS